MAKICHQPYPCQAKKIPPKIITQSPELASIGFADIFPKNCG
ncbi:hypothetical protein [Moraxella cuniculi]|nr:hypothetical protein [Moraxella cuniculi]